MLPLARYKKYVVIDPLKGAVTRTRDQVEEQNALAAAPQTILEGEYYKTEYGETYRYVPNIGHVPEIQAPMMLGGLSGVADIQFDEDIGSIAPSAGNAELNVPDLPGIETAAPTAAPAALPDAPASVPAAPTAAPSVPGAPPPPRLLERAASKAAIFHCDLTVQAPPTKLNAEAAARFVKHALAPSMLAAPVPS